MVFSTNRSSNAAIAVTILKTDPGGCWLWMVRFISGRFLLLMSLIITFGVMLAAQSAFCTTILLDNASLNNPDFSDTTPITPAGNNPEATIGQARQIAFQYAANIWAI